MYTNNLENFNLTSDYFNIQNKNGLIDIYNNIDSADRTVRMFNMINGDQSEADFKIYPSTLDIRTVHEIAADIQYMTSFLITTMLHYNCVK